jgi:hypothetical protein
VSHAVRAPRRGSRFTSTSAVDEGVQADLDVLRDHLDLAGALGGILRKQRLQGMLEEKPLDGRQVGHRMGQ